MEQMYLIEVFIDKVTIFLSEDEDKSTTNKSLIIKVQLGPEFQFIIKEGQLAKQERKDEFTQEEGIEKWTRTIKVGKSYLFPSYSDRVLNIVSKFPLEIAIWNDDENEVEIFVGAGQMIWDLEFYRMLKDAFDCTKHSDPLSIKNNVAIFNECCCKQVGVISFIVRVSVLGDSIITDFQQLFNDPDLFIFQTNKTPSKFQCNRIEPDDPKYNEKNDLYFDTLEQDPDVIASNKPTIQICTELQSCGVADGAKKYICEHGTEKTEESKKAPLKLDKIKMSQIIGPCGNANCVLAHKVKNYIRNLESYKKEYQFGAVKDTSHMTRKICGTCSCKDDRDHTEDFQELPLKTTCDGCGGRVIAGDMCEDRKKKMYGTGLTPRQSPTQINYVLNINNGPNLKESTYGRDFIVDSLDPNTSYIRSQDTTKKPSEIGCHCRSKTEYTICNVRSSPIIKAADDKASKRNFGTNDNLIYNNTIEDQSFAIYNAYKNCTEPPINNDCSCNPPKQTPPCRTFDCDCLSDIVNTTARLNHKSYCPLYKHKPTCPVTMSLEEDSQENQDEVEDKAEPLPYGLPSVRLGPCPILGRPCSVPDGFARMYRNANLPPLPPSHSEAGKVCCSTEYWRIKKAIKEYLKNHKDDDFRCINRFNVDTERRCCDKEQALIELMGKSCCGSHKLSIQDKYKDK